MQFQATAPVGRVWVKLVAESARAHSYYSISTGMQTARPPAVPFLTPGSKVFCTLPVVSKSIFYTPDGVKKCLIDSLSVLSEVFKAAERAGWHRPPQTRIDHMGFGVVLGKETYFCLLSACASSLG